MAWKPGHRIVLAEPGATRTLLARNVSPTTPASRVDRWFSECGHPVESIALAADPETLDRKVCLVAD